MDADAGTLTKIAAWGITFSIIVTALLATFASGSNPDYDYDMIRGYQDQLVEFGGEALLNDTPWVLQHAYTPFDPNAVSQEDYPDHKDESGWLFGEDRINSYYPGDKPVANIRLDKDARSNQKLSIGDPTGYDYRGDREWWNGGNDYGIVIVDPWLANIFTGGHSGDGYKHITGTGNNWNYTGIRWVFDPTLPFSAGGSAKDGQLSIVWYNTATDTGLSGGLDIYGSNHQYGTPAADTRLASISASDIIAAYETNSGYASIYDFDFDGVHIKIGIQFDANVTESYPSLRAAWDDGAWTMSVSSVSAGNFFDVDNSTAFVDSAGNMVETFIQIYTFKTPEFQNNPWANVILWLLVGLPMTLGLLFITARLVGGVFKIF